jgi:hypothetical protein
VRTFFTPSMGVACLALAVALSGTGYAVTRLPANSVGTKQVINRSLQGVDFKRGTLLRGPVGPQGPALSPSRISIRSKGAEISPTAGVDTNVSVTCPEGSIAALSLRDGASVGLLQGCFRITSSPGVGR